LNWLRSHYHCGDDADFSRINFLGNYLDGVAADWFAADIDNPDKVMDAPITFIDAICAMHRWFMRTAMANNTTTQYDKVEYTPSTGVEGFYYALDKLASRMVKWPSDYSFRLRMFEGLPTWIYDTLLEWNILPEFCTLEDICENARQIEEISLRMWNTLKGSSAAGNTSRSTTNRNTTSRNNNILRNVSITASRNNPLCIDTKGKSSISTSPSTHIMMWLEISTQNIAMFTAIPRPGELWCQKLKYKGGGIPIRDALLFCHLMPFIMAHGFPGIKFIRNGLPNSL
jgi:hypothetical protein